MKQSFSLELVPHTLTGRAFYKEMKTFVTDTYLSHDWRTTWTEQAHRVYEDKKSGAPRDAALAVCDATTAAADRAATTARTTALLSLVAPILARFAINFGAIGTAVVGDGAEVTTFDYRLLPHTLAAIERAAAASAINYSAAAEIAAETARDSERAASIAVEVQAVLARSASVQSDYAAQVETQRSRTATCATRERHNLLVSVVGYKPYRVWAEKSKRWIYKQA